MLTCNHVMNIPTRFIIPTGSFPPLPRVPRTFSHPITQNPGSKPHAWLVILTLHSSRVTSAATAMNNHSRHMNNHVNNHTVVLWALWALWIIVEEFWIIMMSELLQNVIRHSPKRIITTKQITTIYDIQWISLNARVTHHQWITKTHQHEKLFKKNK